MFTKKLISGGFYVLLVVVMLLAFVNPALAASVSTDGFNPGAYGDFPGVNILTVQPDGKILVGGEFTTLGGSARSNIGRLNPDGTLDTGFNPGANGVIYALIVQPDGKILVGGDFTTLGGQTRNYIGRLNADGSLDAAFNPGANNRVYALAVQPDGKILVGGWFSMLGGSSRNYIGRLNSDGTLDTSFNPGANGAVYALLVQPDGKILVGGWFSTLGGSARSQIGRLNANGSLDTSFNSGANGIVNSLAVQADSKIIVGGIFTTLGGSARSNIGRLNLDGTLDIGFNPGANGEVNSVVVQPDGKILVGGFFTTLGGSARNYIGRLNLDGTLEAGFNPGADYAVNCLAVQADSKIVVGGLFTTLGGSTRYYIGRLYADGMLDTTLNPGANGSVRALAVQADGKIIVGGNFTTLGGSTRSYIGRLNADGSLDTAFNPGANGAVYVLVVQPDGKVLVGGSFTTLGGSARSYIGRLNADGTLDAAFNPGANGAIYALAVQADGKILVGGNFTTLGGSTRSYIGRLNADGSLDTAFNPGANGAVYALVVQPDGKILVGGYFTTLGGQPCNYVGRLNVDGTLDESFNPVADNRVYALAVQPDGKIVMGGQFTALGGSARGNIGRLNADGSLDTTFNAEANDWVCALGLQTDGKILVGGWFTKLNGQSRMYVGRLNADGSLDTNFNPGTNGVVYAQAVQPDGKILVGGGFTTLGGSTRNYIGRLSADTVALQNLASNSSGTTLTWQRSGAGPEIYRITFESSTDGVTYTSLGAGTRIVGGWQLTGLALPKGQNLFIRARGYYATGFGNGSGSVVESVRNVVVKDTTTTVTADDPDPSVVGQAVVVSYTVTSIYGTPIGSVTVSDGVNSCTGTVVVGSCTITLTTLGTRTLTATYAGDANFNGSSGIGWHQVKASTTTSITAHEPDPSVVGQTVVVSYTVTSIYGTPIGSVTVSDGVNSCTGTVAEGACTITLTTLGARTLTATYAGNANFNGSSDNEPHQVKANTTTTITSDNPESSLVGQAVVVSYTVTSVYGTPTGNITVTDGVDSCTGTVAEGTCTITLTTLGSRTLAATYAGDANFNGSSDDEPHQVKANTTTAITSDNPDPSLVGQAVVVSYTVTSAYGTPTGSITVTDGVDSCTGTVAEGACTIMLTTLGARTLTATYAGDANFNGSSDDEPHQVKANTTTGLASSLNPSAYGQWVIFTATITSTAGTPSGSVEFYDDGASLGTSLLSSGLATTSTATLPAGTHVITAVYSGDSNFNSSTGALSSGQQVDKANTATSITSDNPDLSLVGQAVVVSYTVTSAYGTPTGSITVTDGVDSCTGTVVEGACTITVTTLGARTLTATYAGDANFNGSSDDAPHQVKANTTTAITSDNPDPSLVGQAVLVSYTVTSAYGTPTGSITVTDGVDSCTGTVAEGACTITLTTLGSRTLAATYAGDANFNGSSDDEPHQVKANTTTAITSDSPDPSLVGQAVLVSYTVTSAYGTPTGSITVTDGVDSCTGTVAEGACTITVTTLGVRTLTATYAGDANFNGSSDDEPHQVKANTATTITSDNPDPSLVGQAVVVSYTVTSAYGTPTGSITVTDGVDSCTGTVAEGTCTITLTTLGSRTLTATYVGDASFNGSSADEPHQVKANTTTAITSDNPDLSLVGQAVVVSYTVTSAYGTPTGSITVTDGVDSCTGTVAEGTCTITLTTLGSRTLTATYVGDASFNGSSADEPHQVKANTTTAITSDNPDPSLVGQAVVVSYTVTSAYGTPTGLITVTDGVDSCTGTVAEGACTITLTTLGSRTLAATYAGDANFNGSSDDEPHQVKANTTTTITSDNPEPSLVGQAVVVSYTVTSAYGTPTGNITVIDGVDSCTGTVAEGACTITLTTLGARTLTATYAGDASFNGSSSTAAHTVNNQPPVANAGNDQSVNTNVSVTLNGSTSSDPDGNTPLTYGWKQTGGPEVTFNSAFSITTFMVPSSATVITFTLTVTDSLGLADPTPDEVVITVSLPQADLTISKTDNQITATAGSLITYTIIVTNNGPSAVTGANVVDTLPENLTDVNWTCTASAGSSCAASGSGNLNDSVNLQINGRVTYQVIGRIASSATGMLSNTATVTVPAGMTDPVSNNSITDTTEIVSAPGPASYRVYLPLVRR